MGVAPPGGVALAGRTASAEPFCGGQHHTGIGRTLGCSSLARRARWMSLSAAHDVVLVRGAEAAISVVTYAPSAVRSNAFLREATNHPAAPLSTTVAHTDLTRLSSLHIGLLSCGNAQIPQDGWVGPRGHTH